MSDIKWCFYCKEEISEYQDYVKIKGKFYHQHCWKLLNNEIDDECDPYTENSDD